MKIPRKPPNERCAYINYGATKADNYEIPLHRFPMDDRLPTWLEHAGNTKLSGFAPATVRKYGLCNKHFDESSFTNSDKTKLKWKAIPKPHNPRGGTVGTSSNLQLEAGSHDPPGVTLNDVEMNRRVGDRIEARRDNSFTSPPSTSSTTNRAENDPMMPDSMDMDVTHYIVTEEETIQRAPTPGIQKSIQLTEIDRGSISNVCCEKLASENERLYVDKANLRRENNKLRSENDKQQSKIEFLTGEIKKYQYAIRQIPAKIKKAKEQMTLEEFLETREIPLTPVAHTMVKLQLHKPNTPYDNDEKELANQFLFHSNSLYERMRSAGLNLPGLSTVRGWLSTIDIQPGFCDVIFKKIEQMMEKLPPDQRLCSLGFDEMSIKGYEEYSEKYDLIEGFVDLGPLGRRNERAKFVFSFNLTSLNAENRWRQPVAYFLTGQSGMSSEEIFFLVKECLRKLKEAKADVRLIVCDQGSNNVGAFNNLFKATIKEPWFEFEGKIYYLCYDFPHLIKRLITMLRTHEEIWANNEVIVSWADFDYAKLCDSMNPTSHLLDHITDVHLNPTGIQSMNVKRAFQMLSWRYAQAIKLAGQSAEDEVSKQMQSGESSQPQCFEKKTYERSAEFAETMNNIIDACNSHGLTSSNPQNRPLSPRNPEIEELILNLVEWAAKWRIKDNSVRKKLKGGSEFNFKVPPCFNGLQLTGNALVGVYKSIQADFPSFEFATARGNQDGNEHWFALLRARGGNCQNPTARMVRLSVRHVLSLNSINIGDQGNVKCNETNYLTAPTTTRVSKG